MSRAMIFNQLAIYLGIIKNLKLYKKKIKPNNWCLYLSLLIITFLISIYIVSIERNKKFHATQASKSIVENVLVAEKIMLNNDKTKDFLEKRFNTDNFFNENFKRYPLINNFIYLIINRWVGLDAIFAVVSSDKLSFSFFKESLGEKFDSTKYSFYEREILERIEDYTKHGIRTNYGILIPGFIAFSFYAGSFLVMSMVISILYSVSILIEYFSLKLSDNNVIFSSLIGQVCAYRLIHFGYIPSQSYLLLLSILLNIILFYFIIWILNFKKL